MSGQFLLFPYFIESPVFNANTVVPDQMLHSAASDLGLCCLPMSLLWDARLKWVKIISKLGSLIKGKILTPMGVNTFL